MNLCRLGRLGGGEKIQKNCGGSRPAFWGGKPSFFLILSEQDRSYRIKKRPSASEGQLVKRGVAERISPLEWVAETAPAVGGRERLFPAKECSSGFLKLVYGCLWAFFCKKCVYAFFSNALSGFCRFKMRMISMLVSPIR